MSPNLPLITPWCLIKTTLHGYLPPTHGGSRRSSAPFLDLDNRPLTATDYFRPSSLELPSPTAPYPKSHKPPLRTIPTIFHRFKFLPKELQIYILTLAYHATNASATLMNIQFYSGQQSFSFTCFNFSCWTPPHRGVERFFVDHRWFMEFFNLMGVSRLSRQVCLELWTRGVKADWREAAYDWEKRRMVVRVLEGLMRKME